MDNKLGKQMFDGGYGLLKTAQFILEKETELPRSLLRQQGTGCKLVFAGHSLGSGVAALMTILVVNNCRMFDGIPRSHVRCYALAPARCMSLNLAVKYADVIYSIVLQHVPKTNGEIPSVDEAFSDHRRLLDRLVLYGLVELKVNGDGDCQEAVSNGNRKEEKWVGSQMEHHACRSSTLFRSVTSSGVVVKVLLLLFPFNIDNCNFAFRNWWTTGS